MANRQLEHADHHPSAIRFPLCFLAHDIDVPMNVGSFFRIADALGVEKIYLTGSSMVPPNAKIKKTSRGTEKHVAHEHHDDPVAVVERLKQAGCRIVSLEITSTSLDIARFPVEANEKICLILGSENTGVTQRLLDLSDASVHIPMLGNNSSMNVANACAIATYTITRKLDP